MCIKTVTRLRYHVCFVKHPKKKKTLVFYSFFVFSFIYMYIYYSDHLGSSWFIYMIYIYMHTQNLYIYSHTITMSCSRNIKADETKYNLVIVFIRLFYDLQRLTMTKIRCFRQSINWQQKCTRSCCTVFLSSTINPRTAERVITPQGQK